ncbi:MAG: acetylglutamate kinase [Pseudomonadota bacterium]
MTKNGNDTRRQTRQVIVQLLSNMSDGKEIRGYLQRFSEVDKARFAVVKIGGAILRDDLDTAAAALAFLQTVGLTPIVVHGAGPQLDEVLAARGVKTVKHEGLRVTTPEVLEIARDVFLEQNLRLADAIRARGVAAASLPSGVFEAELVDKEKLGLVGDAVGVRYDLVSSVIQSGAVPVLTCLGETKSGQIVNINGDAVTRAMVHAAKPFKIIFLTGTGGLLDAEDKVIDSINMAEDFDRLMAEPWVHSGMRVKLQEIDRLLKDLPATSSVSITSPSKLVQELFTHGGAGTLLRRGERILTYDGKDKLDRERLTMLIESAFGKPLQDGYWDGLSLKKAYVSEGHRACAFITEVGGVAYLNKYAVLEDARGEGIGKAVWRAMRADHPQLLWRSRADNPVNGFYLQNADGHARRGDWTVFWSGLEDLTAIAPLVEEAAAPPADFIENGDES